MNMTRAGSRHASTGGAGIWRTALVGLALCAATGGVLAQRDVPTRFDYSGTIGNTRHNLTQRQTSGGGPVQPGIMNSTRNDYGEVCVYCHTPHAANRTTTAPLWNRTMKVTTYQTYNLLGTTSLTQPVSQPGVNSLTCLSCHDGQTAIDAIINMPGSGRYSASMETSDADRGFLDSWPNPPSAGRDHATMGGPDSGCMACHQPTASGRPQVPGATDFTVFLIGTDLRNDHPVGVRFPPNAGPGSDFKEPPRREPRIAYFDTNANARPDSGEIRLYNTGDGYEVECASCHDPHGVPSGGPGTVFNPSFLRVSNVGSGVCLTCHTK